MAYSLAWLASLSLTAITNVDFEILFNSEGPVASLIDILRIYILLHPYRFIYFPLTYYLLHAKKFWSLEFFFLVLIKFKIAFNFYA